MGRTGLVYAFVTLAALAGGCSSKSTPPPGQKCLINSDCNNPLSCTYGACHQECKEARDCPAGATCVKTEKGDSNVCLLAVEERCSMNSSCPAPLKCALDLKCRQQCNEDRDCATKTQKCVANVCAEPEDIDATGKLKGGSGGGSPDGGGGASMDSGAKPDAGGGAGDGPAPASDATKNGIGYTLSNVNSDFLGLDVSKVADILITGGNNPINGDTGDFTGTRSEYAYKRIDRPDGSRIGLFVVKSLRIEANGFLNVVGPLPVVIVALDTITVAGTLRAEPGVGGGGVPVMDYFKGAGPGGGPGGTSTGNLVSGSGASFCGVGGSGAPYMSAGMANSKSMAYGTPDLVPLVAGSSGGSGAINNGGKGGGAIQLSAGKSIAVTASGIVNFPGAGGGFGGVGNQGAGGGGAGGAILIEAPMVTIAGIVAANGGGGGAGESGENGKAGTDQAAGGMSMRPNVPVGGVGGAGDKPDGANGTSSNDAPGGGGGGAAGRIRVNAAGMPMITGTVSPTAKSSCLTVGALK